MFLPVRGHSAGDLGHARFRSATQVVARNNVALVSATAQRFVERGHKTLNASHRRWRELRI